jgi:hypothetical protein
MGVSVASAGVNIAVRVCPAIVAAASETSDEFGVALAAQALRSKQLSAVNIIILVFIVRTP